MRVLMQARDELKTDPPSAVTRDSNTLALLEVAALLQINPAVARHRGVVEQLPSETNT
jgi:hypothetical protein